MSSISGHFWARTAATQRAAERVGTAPFRGLGQALACDHVVFSYGEGAPVLHDITLEIKPGRTTAIVGSTGSGKSTLINLIPRFYDVTEGSLEIDGVDVRDVLRDDLWDRIGLIPQKAFLFSGTIASNLRFGKADATDDELWTALRIAQAESFVRDLPEGLESPVSQAGANFSGGQRQRLAIARALVKRPSIYVFDDSFSALDLRTDANLRAALAREVRDATVVIVAQRVGTIMTADQIVVLDRGTIVGVGQHDELLETCETYREIVDSQLGAEEGA